MPKVNPYDIELWIKTIPTGDFHYKEVLDGNIDSEYYGKLRRIMHDLCHQTEPVCETVGRRDGYYRPIDNGVGPIDFTKLRPKDFPIILPFDLRKYVFIYPDTTIIYAGSKSSGKSGLIYQTIKLNWNKINIRLLSNMEGGREQMYDRFKAMGIDLATVPKFIYPVNDHFHDHIKDRDTIYFIDYIDAPEGDDFYLIGGQIKKCDHKLQGLNSVAVIALQKPPGRDTAFGGEPTLKVASLYLALDSNKLKIVDAKVPADKKTHPKNMQWTFTYDKEGTQFCNIQPYYGSEE
ncbi:hypothetical protein IIB97_00395 [Patescibacteria group bacterium]|nr:hypothetical protein [Patescibacteria group bacterium]